MLAMSGLAWSHLPQTMAVHFGADGADGFADKRFGLLAVPVTALLGTALVVASLRYEQWRGQLKPHRPTLVSLVWLVAMVMLTGVHASMIVIALT